jgi:NAD(P)-dependent dehydrogenase (short-subunit alcohol dehydrogenase family)
VGTALVTGGAKRLGAAIARRLAADGHRVVVHHGRSREEAAALAAELGGVAVGCDLADLDAVDGLLLRAAEAAGAPVDVLINSASQFEWDEAPGDPGLAERLTRVNLYAPVRLACGVKDGVVVNLLDQKVGNLNPDFFSYTLTKLALAGATEMLARRLAPRVRVNAVSPGLTLPSGDQSAGEFARAGAKNLLRRPVGADAVAEAVSYLVGARSVTGQNLFVDCGQRFLPRDGDVMFEDRDG